MVTALLLITVTPQSIGRRLRANQKFHHKFSAFACIQIAQSYAQVEA